LATVVGPLVALVALAVPRMPSWKRGLLEAAMILGWVALLSARRDFGALVRLAPRVQVWAMSIVFSLWFFAQISDTRMESYPLVAWFMYATPFRDTDPTRLRFRAEDGSGRSLVFGSKEFLGPFANVRTKLGRMRWDLRWARTAQDSVRALARLDSMLVGILAVRKYLEPDENLTALELELVRVPAGELDQQLSPRVETVRRVQPR
jgi:hypothetical protein